MSEAPPEVLLEISQNSQEITCARASFLKKLQAYGKTTLVAASKMWHEIKTWSYLEFNNFLLIVQREISKPCFQKQPSDIFCKNGCS